MPGKWVVDATGRGRLLPLSEQEQAAKAAHRERLAVERPVRHKRRIDRMAQRVINRAIPRARQQEIALTLAELGNKRAGGETLNPSEIAREGAAKAELGLINTVQTRRDALKDAVDAGKKVKIADGSVDGEGAWPSKV